MAALFVLLGVIGVLLALPWLMGALLKYVMWVFDKFDYD